MRLTLVVRPAFPLLAKDATEPVEKDVHSRPELRAFAFGKYSVLTVNRQNRFRKADAAHFRKDEVRGGKPGLEALQSVEALFRPGNDSIGDFAMSLRDLDSHAPRRSGGTAGQHPREGT